MEHHASGTQAAALLRHTVQGEPDTHTMERRRQEQQGTSREAATARSDQVIRTERELERRTRAENDSRFGAPSALTDRYRLPVLETDQFRVVEPDGTEDPLASIDDSVQAGSPQQK